MSITYSEVPINPSTSRRNIRKCTKRLATLKIRVGHHSYEETLRLIEELSSHLSSIEETVQTPRGESITVKKYHYQASEILRDISEGEPPQPFIIYLSDLTPNIVYHLLDSWMKDYVISKAVDKIFSDADPRLEVSRGKTFWMISC